MNEVKAPEYYRDEFAGVARFYDWATKIWFFPFGGETQFRKWVIKQLEIEPGESLLEVCCGTGRLSLLAASKGAVASGVDLSDEMMEVGRKKAGKAGLQVNFYQSNAETLPFNDQAFDKTLASFGLHEMPQEAIISTIKEMSRILKPGGRALIVDFGYPRNPLIRLIESIFLRLVETKKAREFALRDFTKDAAHAGMTLTGTVSHCAGIVNVWIYEKAV